jgi:hypothetical protein
MACEVFHSATHSQYQPSPFFPNASSQSFSSFLSFFFLPDEPSCRPGNVGGGSSREKQTPVNDKPAGNGSSSRGGAFASFLFDAANYMTFFNKWIFDDD